MVVRGMDSSSFPSNKKESSDSDEEKQQVQETIPKEEISIESGKKEIESGKEEIVSNTNLNNNNNENETQETQEEEEEEKMSQEQLLEYCFLYGIKKIKDPELPILVSTFYSSYVLPARPENTQIEIKKSKYKKVHFLFSLLIFLSLLNYKFIF
jgi:hypothetical protein